MTDQPEPDRSGALFRAEHEREKLANRALKLSPGKRLEIDRSVQRRIDALTRQEENKEQ